MLEKINFRVIHATSEDPSFASSELERHGPGVNGWRSDKSATFPQELILQLESRARLGHMQLLAHQYIIPQTIELYIGEFLGDGDNGAPPNSDSYPSLASMSLTGSACYSNKIDLDKAHFVLLGHVTMAKNDSTGYKARELKSISMDCRGSLVKILIQNNYVNKYNKNQQVALVAINLLGEKLDEDVEMTKSSSQIIFEEMSQTEQRDKTLFSPYDDLAFTMYVDLEVQGLIKKLDLKKQEAVLDERFDYASKLKSSIEHLRKSGELLAKYQLEKQIAASREDFQRAKEKKTQMDTFRDNLYKSLRIKQLLEPNGRVPENDEPGKILGVSGMTRSITELSLPPTTSSAASTPESTTSDRFSSRLTTPDNEKKESGYYSSEEPKFPPPLFIKKRKPVANMELLKEPKDELYNSSSTTATTTAVTTTNLANAPCSSCIRPSNMSERARRYAALPIQVFGDALVEKLFSKNFAVKEDGLRSLQKTLSDYKRSDKTKTDPPSKIFRAASLLLQRTIKDTIFSVFNLTIITLTYLMDDFAKKHRLPASELSQGLERILPELLSKSGDTALGKNKVASECILKLQSCQHLRALHVISSNLTKPFDIPVHPRLAQSKAEMVEELLNTYGLSSEKHSGLTARDFVEFGVTALHQPSECVRRVAERLLVALYNTHPKLVRQNLPLEEDISPKNVQYRQLFSQFDKIDKSRKDGSAHMPAILRETKSAHPMTSSVYIPKI